MLTHRRHPTTTRYQIHQKMSTNLLKYSAEVVLDRTATQPGTTARRVTIGACGAHHRLPEPVPPPCQGLRAPEPQRPRVPQRGPCPSHAPKTMPANGMIADGLSGRAGSPPF